VTPPASSSAPRGGQAEPPQPEARERRLGSAPLGARRDRLEPPHEVGHAGLPLRVAERRGLPVDERPQLLGERRARRERGAAHEHRHHRDVAPQRLARLDPNPIVGVVEAAAAGGRVGGVESSRGR
jgi:hypothetical protein